MFIFLQDLSINTLAYFGGKALTNEMSFNRLMGQVIINGATTHSITTLSITIKNVTLSIMALDTAKLSVAYAESRKEAHYADCHYAECRGAVINKYDRKLF